MILTIRALTPDEARDVASWVYEPPFDVYNSDPGRSEVFLRHDERGLGYYAIVDSGPGEMVGFCCFGPEGRVQGQEEEQGTLDVGCGIRPDRISRGIGTEAFPLILSFGRQRFHPERFRAAVAVFNERSTRLCLSAGFKVVRTFQGPNRMFHELVRPAVLSA